MKKRNIATIAAIGVATLAISALVAAPVFASEQAENSTTEDQAVLCGGEEDYEYTDDWYDDCIDYGDLTQDEIDELNAIYDRLAAIEEEIWGVDYENYDENMTDEEIEAAYAPYDDEINELCERAWELEEKAGWVCDAEDCDCYCDYGDLTQDQIDELNAIYDRYAEIDAAVWGENYELYDPNMTDEEYENMYSDYAEELEQLDARAAELEELAWGSYDSDYSDYYDDADYSEYSA